MSELTHFDAAGRARMVDVGDKPATQRVAIARGRVVMRPETLRVIVEGRAAKGDVLGVAQVAAIMGVKQTAALVPMCHPIPITAINVALTPDPAGSAVLIEARVESRGQTGVEMEALTAVSVAALTVYDMVKAIDRGMTIEGIALMHKSGGQSGDWQRAEG